jgi:hypothetical protein
VPFRSVVVQPGIDTQHTPTQDQAQLTLSNLIRYRSGMVEKRGGWQQLNATPLVGTCSGLHAFDDLSGNIYLAAGTEQRLEILTGGILSDITPLVTTTNPTVQFSTTTGSSVVTVLDAGYTPSVGDWVYIPTPVAVGEIVVFGYQLVTGNPGANEYLFDTGLVAGATVVNGGAVPTYTSQSGQPNVTVTFANHGLNVGGIYNAVISTAFANLTISGRYSVISVFDANQFTIVASTTANASTTVGMNGGNAQIWYLIPTGFARDTVLLGYGSGNYGSGDYGGSTSGGTALEPARQWSLDNFGQILIASPTNGGIYQWTPPTIAPAVVVSGSAPLHSTAVFVMASAQIVVALGAEVFGQQQPLLVRWSTNGDFTDWTPTVSNQAGSYTIPQGNKLVGGVASGLTAILWTDEGVYLMSYQGLPFVFGFQPIAPFGCGLIGSRGFAVIGQMVFWISPHGFFEMSTGGGSPAPVQCEVWDILYNNWDLSQAALFVMGGSPTHNEFELHFPLAQSSPLYVAGSVTKGSVKFNYVDRAWDFSITPQLQRTAWLMENVQAGASPNTPAGTDLDGIIQQHEIGYDANGSAMLWSWQSADYFVGDGEDISFVDWLIPDIIALNNPTLRISLLFRNLPTDDYTVVGPFSWTTGNAFIPLFAGRGRQMAIRAEGNDMGSFNRMGRFRYRIAADGRGY